MTRILVTGGFGFLGTHLVEELIAQNDTHVHILDDLSTSPIEVESFLAEIGYPKNLTYTIKSIAQAFPALKKEHFDQVYHLASVVGPAGVLSHAGRIVQAIVDETYRIMDLALAWKARLVDVSTSEVYGGVYQEACTEQHAKVFPSETTIRMEYGVGKLAAEVALVNLCRVHGLKACIVRPFNISGPRQSGKGGFVLPRFVEQAIAGKPITVFGDGSQIRAFTHVKDMAHGVVVTMAHGRIGEIYNLGNARNKTTILELARRVVELAESRSAIAFVNPKTLFGPLYAEVGDKHPDAAKAMRELGWSAQFDIDTVVRDAIEYMRSHPPIAKSSRKVKVAI